MAGTGRKKMNLNLNKKVALVFGSSAGIGLAIAKSLINEGASVYINGRNKESLESLQQSIGAKGFIVADLSKPNSAQKAVEEVIEKEGCIHILINNTGGPKKANFLETSIDQWNEDYQSLWLSPVSAMHAAIPSMQKEQFGRIIFVTSIAAKEPLSGLTTSNGLRAGLQGLSKSISNEFAIDGITINLLLPGYTNTERIQALNLSESKIKEMVPAGRLGEPQELADLATFLSSEKGSYITGQSIAVDGGVLRSH